MAVDFEALAILCERDLPKGLNAVNAGGAEHEEPGAASAAELEHIDGAEEVVFQKLAAAGAAIDAGKHTGVGSGVDDPVHIRQALKVAGLTDITVEQADAKALQGEAVDLGTRTAEVVKAERGPAAGDKVAQDLATCKATGTSDEDARWGGEAHEVECRGCGAQQPDLRGFLVDR